MPQWAPCSGGGGAVGPLASNCRMPPPKLSSGLFCVQVSEGGMDIGKGLMVPSLKQDVHSETVESATLRSPCTHRCDGPAAVHKPSSLSRKQAPLCSSGALVTGDKAPSCYLKTTNQGFCAFRVVRKTILQGRVLFQNFAA